MTLVLKTISRLIKKMAFAKSFRQQFDELEDFSKTAYIGRVEQGLMLEQIQSTQRYLPYPLILISQERRSGGTLLSQLFDNHSHIYSHSGELKTGYPSKEVWPPIDETRNWRFNYRMIFDKGAKTLRTGYKKGRATSKRLKRYQPNWLLRTMFRFFWLQYPPQNKRDIFNIYFSSYFAAWLDYNDHRHSGSSNYIAAFTPALMNSSHKTKIFFEMYPDGFLLGS